MEPTAVNNVSVNARGETYLTFQWDIVDNNRSYSYKLINGSVETNLINVTEADSVVTYTVSSLSPGFNYSFTIYTVFMNNLSEGYNFWAVTGK